MALLLGNMFSIKNHKTIFTSIVKIWKLQKICTIQQMCKYLYTRLTKVYVKNTFLFYKVSNLLVVYDRSLLSRNC